MRIHTDKLTTLDLSEATKDLPGVYIESMMQHGSRKRARGIEFRLAAEPGPGLEEANEDDDA